MPAYTRAPMSKRTPRLDRASFGWWLGTESAVPYKSNQKGVFFARKDSKSPGEILGLDLRTAKEPTTVKLARAVGFLFDAKAAAALLAQMLPRPKCPSCKAAKLELLADDHVACKGCGGMFDLDAFRSETSHPIALDWAARLEGSWKAGAEEVVVAQRPLMVSAKGAQAHRAAVAVARAVPLRAFAPCELTDADIAALGAQPQMQSLDLWFNRNLTAKGFAHLTGYTGLEHLNVGNNPAVDDGVAADVAKLDALVSFEAEQTQIGDAGLAALAKLPRLETLILSSVPITDDGLAALRKHKTLRRIAVGWTKITDAGLAHLATIPNLTSVEAWDCKLKGGSPKAAITAEALRAAL